MTELAQYCHEADFDSATNTCSAPYWGPAADSGALPPLSIADANAIGASIALLWAVAWGFRRLKRFLDQS